MKHQHAFSFIAGILIGMVFALPLYAQFISWQKDEVLPVVLVKPAIGGFEPIEGTSIGNTWPKNRVIPLCVVKTGVGGFIPKEGTSIGNTWSKDEVKPMVMVQPSMGRFVPVE